LIVNTLTIGQDVILQRRIWIGQRIGWSAIAAVIVAGLAGLFGDGPLSRSSAGAANLRIEYERFLRLQQPAKLRCFVTGAPAEAQIALNRDFVGAVRIDAIMPVPVRVEDAGDWTVFRFSGSALSAVTFHFTPAEFGSLSGMVRTGKGEAIRFHQFIYP
jgi:hypothetical protein